MVRYFWIAFGSIVCGAIVLYVMLGGVRQWPIMGQKTVHIGGVSVIVDIASTTAAREQGLSGRMSLPAGTGMLFVFDQAGPWGFWMKDMEFPIDIIWVDAAGSVVTIQSSLSPDSYPSVFYGASTSRYVLEVPAGFAREHSIAIGTQMMLPSPGIGT